MFNIAPSVPLFGALLSRTASPGHNASGDSPGEITEESFGQTPDGTPVKLFTLRNAAGTEARITNYGGIVVSLRVPDRAGALDDIVLGYDSLDEYIENSTYFGCLIGRYGNRIAGGEFTLGGKVYNLATNNGPHHLHGGLRGFNRVVWAARSLRGPDGPALELRYTSPDGEEGYPGNLSIQAVYTLTPDPALRLDFTATTDQETICNLTHHSYFNLAGPGVEDIRDHEVMIAADQFTPVDATLIPTGELQRVAGTPLDFTQLRAIGARIDHDEEQLRFANGYDHNWVLNKPPGALGLAARVYEPTTGRVMEVLTTAPGLQFYTGNFLDGSQVGKGGQTYPFRCAFCMEPQHFPDSPNQPHFPSTVLQPGQTYHHTIMYRFAVR